MKKAMILITMLSMPLSLWALPKVTMELKVEAERMVEEDGKMVEKRLEVESAEPGEELIYTITYTNAGDETATNVNIKNKIPDNSTYLLDSAWGEGSDIAFSIDNGETFNKPSLLTYEVTTGDGKTIKKQVSPDKYTDIKWVVKDIPPGSSGKVGFNIKID